MRIIRCIRIDPDIYYRTKDAAKTRGTFVSHIIEARLRSFLSEIAWEELMKAISPKPATRKEEDEHDAKPANKN